MSKLLLDISKIKEFPGAPGPGISLIAYVLGTGGVTTMALSGIKFGMSMTWSLASSSFFTNIKILSSGSLTKVSGNTISLADRAN